MVVVTEVDADAEGTRSRGRVVCTRRVSRKSIQEIGEKQSRDKSTE